MEPPFSVLPRQNSSSSPSVSRFRASRTSAASSRGGSGGVSQGRVDNLVLQMLSIIRKLVDNDNSPPMAMMILHKYAEEENGWISIVNSMIKVR